MHPSALVSPTLGAQRARVATSPPYRRTWGPEATELAASAGLTLDPWQRNALDVMLALRDDGKWCCFECGVIVPRQNGKGAILEARSLAGLYLFGERLIMWSAHEYKTAMEGFRRVRALIDNTDDLRRQVKRISNTNGEEAIELLSGQRLRFIARSKGSGRGFSGDCNLLDEAYAYTEDQKSALMPTVSARPNPQIVYTSSPPLDEETGEPLYSLKDRGEAGDDPGLGWLDWGVSLDLDEAADRARLSDVRLWADANPALGIRITEETIEREYRSMSPEGFARERLGVWPKRRGRGILIDPRAWARLADAESTVGDDVCFAVDVTPLRDHSAIVAYGRRADGLGHGEVIDHRPGTEWVIERLRVLRDRWRPVGIVLDPRGPALSLLLDLERAGFRRAEEIPRRGDVVLLSTSEAAAACGQLVDAVAQGDIRHRDQAPLNIAVAGAKTRPLGDAWGWARRAASVDISPLCALTIARWAYESRIDAVRQPYDPMANIW